MVISYILEKGEYADEEGAEEETSENYDKYIF